MLLTYCVKFYSKSMWMLLSHVLWYFDFLNEWDVWHFAEMLILWDVSGCQCRLVFRPNIRSYHISLLHVHHNVKMSVCSKMAMASDDTNWHWNGRNWPLDSCGITRKLCSHIAVYIIYVAVAMLQSHLMAASVPHMTQDVNGTQQAVVFQCLAFHFKWLQPTSIHSALKYLDCTFKILSIANIF